MTAPLGSGQPDDQPFPARRAYLGLGLLVIAFALYGSLLPFELRPTSLQSAWSRYQTIVLAAPSRISRSDLLANILLFVPVGFGLAGALLVDRAHRGGLGRATALILPFSLAVSALAEFLQMFVGGRVPSSTDITAQLAGCFAGIVVWAIAGDELTGWLRQSLASAPRDRLSRVLTAFAAGWVFVNLAPFDITVDVGDLASRLRSGKISIVPFNDWDSVTARAAWDALAEVLSGIPLGAFGLVGLNRRRRWSSALAFGRGAAIVSIVELAQVFIASHSASSTDLIFAWLGIAAGVLVGQRWLPRPETTDAASRPDLSRGALWVLAGWCLVLCAYHWAPYDFVTDPELIRRKLSRVSLMPFAGYRSGSELAAFSNLLTKLALSAPLGVAGAFAFRIRRLAKPITLLSVIAVAGLIFAGIEVGQFFLPRRVPDPTDILVGIAGTCAGLVVGRWLHSSDGGRPEKTRLAQTFRP